MSRSPLSQRTESERKVLEYLYRRQPQQARTKDLRQQAGLSPATLHAVLGDLERRQILEAHRERHQTIYLWTDKAENYYRGIIPKQVLVTRKYYDELTKRVSMNASAVEFIEQTTPAIGITILPVLIESIEKKREILLQPLINDFLFFIKKFLLYRKYPEAPIERVAKALQELEDNPQAFRREIDELQGEVAEYRRNLRKDLKKH